MATITLQKTSTAPAGPGDILLRDLGLLVPSDLSVLSFSDMLTIKAIRKSVDLIPYAKDFQNEIDPPSIIVTDGNHGWYDTFFGGGVIDMFLDGEVSTQVLTNVQTETNTTTTTSSTYTQIGNMISSIIDRGLWLIEFSATIGNSGANNDVFVSFSQNNVTIADTEVKLDNLFANHRSTVDIALIFNKTDTTQTTFRVQWRRSNGTNSCEVRKMSTTFITQRYGNVNP